MPLISRAYIVPWERMDQFCVHWQRYVNIAMFKGRVVVEEIL